MAVWSPCDSRRLLANSQLSAKRQPVSSSEVSRRSVSRRNMPPASIAGNCLGSPTITIFDPDSAAATTIAARSTVPTIPLSSIIHTPGGGGPARPRRIPATVRDSARSAWSRRIFPGLSRDGDPGDGVTRAGPTRRGGAHHRGFACTGRADHRGDRVAGAADVVDRGLLVFA